MSKQLEYYIYLTIADASNVECDKTDFSSYSGYATYIRRNLEADNPIPTLKYINPIISQIQEIYGFGQLEASKYVILFFLEKKWEKYLKPARMVRAHFGKFLAE